MEDILSKNFFVFMCGWNIKNLKTSNMFLISLVKLVALHGEDDK